jgi:hypothetical protein
VGMHQPVERGEPFGFPENFGSQAFPVNGSIGVEDGLPELADDICVSLAAGEQDFVAELIGLDQVTTQGCHRLSDKSLATGKASGQTNF